MWPGMENPGLHSGGEAIGSESIEFLIECKMVVAQPDQATVERVLATIPKRRRPGVQFAKHEHLLGVQLEFSRRLLYIRFVSRSRQRTGPGSTVRNSMRIYVIQGMVDACCLWMEV